ncbi:Gfo/Idh/MocA family oxidoreductase [Pelagibacteraceae bacterium]|nr:Gfo/Idh/MocA family oxidoreductase [Pelagibacteraceae bacterium]
MKIIIVGYGIQGKKRIKTIKKHQLCGIVDPIIKSADYSYIEHVPLESYDTVILCTPDNKKEKVILYCVKHNKNILVEKPLIFDSLKKLINLEKTINKKKLILYTAYNHRFEPNIIKLKKIIDKKKLGKLYSCRMFYGNGTAKLVKNSFWKDDKNGVLNDLIPHLIDLCIFLFGHKHIKEFVLVSYFRHENNAPDHIVIKNNNLYFNIELEATYCMWRNSFSCDLIGEFGSAHLNSLCKWGPAELILRKRKFPSGKPIEKKNIINSVDNTWVTEFKYFKSLVNNKKKQNLSTDLKILKNIINLQKKIKL